MHGLNNKYCLWRNIYIEKFDNKHINTSSVFGTIKEKLKGKQNENKNRVFY